MRLKSRTKYPAGGFQMLFPQSGMTKPFSGSFAEAVRFTHNFFAKNPALVEKNGWSLDITYIENFVDQYNAQRMVAAGYFNFVDLEGAPPGEKKTFQGSQRHGAGHVADGVRLIVDWLGSGQRPVEKELAEKRAAVCIVCEMNSGGDWKSYFTAPLAAQVKFLLGVKHDMELKTSLDDKLTVCEACDCPLKLKVWTPLKHIQSYMKPEVQNRLAPQCWIRHETAADS